MSEAAFELSEKFYFSKDLCAEKAAVLADSFLHFAIIVNSQGIIVYANQAAQSELKLSPRKMAKLPRLDSILEFQEPKIVSFDSFFEKSEKDFFQTEIRIIGSDNLLIGLMKKIQLADSSLLIYFYDFTLEDSLGKKYRNAIQALTSTIDYLKIMTFVAVCVIDGFTFLAMKVAQKSIPVFLGLGVRQIIVGVIFIVFLFVKNKFEFTRSEIKSALANGILARGIGFALFAVAVNKLPSGIVAIIAAACPIWLFLFQSVATKTKPEKIPLLLLVSSIVFLTMTLVSHGKIQGSILLAPMSLAVMGGIFYALGVQIGAGKSSAGGGIRILSLELCIGAVMTLLISFFTEDLSQFELSMVTPEAWISAIFLLVFSLFVSQPAGRWLTTVSTPFIATTSLLISPIIALSIGALFEKQTIHFNTILYCMGLLISVVLLHLSKSKSSSLFQKIREYIDR